MLAKEDLPVCPVATTVDLIGNKWKVLIIRELLKGTYRFNELHRSIEGINQEVLTENLRKLEADGIFINHPASREEITWMAGFAVIK
ncbi:winged helix-turn-helix transcriptional regulator [Aerococcus urinaeequi]